MKSPIPAFVLEYAKLGNANECSINNWGIMKCIEVVAAVIKQNDKYFATQRGYGEYKDKWEFPGGKVEQGESREEALKREINEELATEIAIDRFICTVDCDYTDFHLIMHTYLCHVVNGKLQLLEAENACWLDRFNLLSVDWLPADRKVLNVLLYHDYCRVKVAGRYEVFG